MVARRNEAGHIEVGFTEEAMLTKRLIEGVAQMAIFVPIDDVQALIDEYNRASTIAPIFDPTAWMRVSRTAPGHLRLASAFLTFRKALDDLVKDDGR